MLRGIFRVIALWGWCAVIASLALAATPEGIELRAFLRDWVGVADSASESTPENLRGVLAAHPKVVVWIAEGRDVNTLLGEAGLTIPGLTVDLNKALKEAIDNAAAEWFKGSVQNESQKSAMLKMAAAAFEQASMAQRMDMLSRITDAQLNSATLKLNSAIKRASFSKHPALQLMTDPKNAIEIPSLSKDKVASLNKLISEYFDGMAGVDKRRVLNAVLSLSPDASLEAQLAAVIQNCGPVFQKLFQLLGKDSPHQLVRNVMAELLSNVRSFPGGVARRVFETSTGVKIREAFAEFDIVPLAAATVGQVHKATLKADGRKVVVKIRRPGLREIAQREIALLKRLASNAFERKLVNDLEEAMERELDFRLEGRNIEIGKHYVDSSLGLAALGIPEGVPVTEEVLVMYEADGINLSKLQGESMEDVGKALSNLLRKWFDVAIFGTGEFHADMHFGNLFYLSRPGLSPPFILTPIDFGSVDKLTVEQRRGVVNLMTGVQFRSTSRVLQGLSQVGTVPEEVKSQLLSALDPILDSDAAATDRLDRIFSEAIDRGIEVPKSVIMFNRGKAFLEKGLLKVNEALGKNKFDAADIYASVLKSRAGVDFKKNVADLLPDAVSSTIFDSPKGTDATITGSMMGNFMKDAAMCYGALIGRKIKGAANAVSGRIK